MNIIYYIDFTWQESNPASRFNSLEDLDNYYEQVVSSMYYVFLELHGKYLTAYYHEWKNDRRFINIYMYKYID